MHPADVKTSHMRQLADFRRGIISAPPLRNLFLELTLRCNERCIHCGSRCGEHDRVPELSLDQYKKILDDVKRDFGTKQIELDITGGEPLLRRDFYDIMGYADALGFRWGMTSNATLINDDIAIYPIEYFAAFDVKNWHEKVTGNTYTIHHMNASWVNGKKRFYFTVIKVLQKILGYNNYDRFKGSRRANVEVHGGAALEEVAVPIIEITQKLANTEAFIVDETKVLTLGAKEHAVIKIFVGTKSNNISIKLGNNYYDANSSVEPYIYTVDLPDYSKKGKYTFDIIKGNETIATGQAFEIKKKLERISVNPVTKQRLLVPPKLVLTFRPSNVLKDKFK